MERHFQHLTDELREVVRDLGIDDLGVKEQPRQEEINSVLKYGEDLKNKSLTAQNSNTRAYYTLAGIFTVSGLLSLLNLTNWDLPFLVSAAPVIGFIGLILTLIFTLKTIQQEPKGELEDRIEKMRERWLKKLKIRNAAGKPYRPVRTRPRKVIAGVAAAIAEKLDMEPNIIRFVLVMLIFASGGSAIPLYILAALFINLGQSQAQSSSHQMKP